jgi:hypothetical protein
VYVIDPRYRTILYNVPIMVDSAGAADHTVWVPTPTTATISGAQLIVSPEGSGLRPTPVQDMNGDHVVLGFMAGDLNRPVILGQLPHPGNTYKPAFPTVNYKLRKLVAGVDLYVGGGNAEVYVGTGNVLTGNKVRVLDADPLITAPEPAMRATALLTDLQTNMTNISASLTEIAGVLAVFGLTLPTTTGTTIPGLTAFLAEIAASLAVGHPYQSTHVEID